jgi:hypothetical protein
MVISSRESYGSARYYHDLCGITNGVPTGQAPPGVCVWARVSQCLRVVDAQAAKEVLRVVGVDHVPPDTEPGAPTVPDLRHEVVQAVAKPGAVADAERILAG